MSFTQGKEFARQASFLRERVIEVLKQKLSFFQNHELAGELDTPVRYAAGHDDQDEPIQAEAFSPQGIEIFHQGTHISDVQPEDCKTEFLIEFLQEVEATQDKIFNENIKS